MNGPNVMYRMKPIVNISGQIELPKCMYRMKNIQQAYLKSHVEQTPNKKQFSSISEQVNKFLKCPLPEMTALENRQEAILAQLAELKNQMAVIRAQLEQSVTPKIQLGKKVMVTRDNELLQNGVIHDIVINASPKYPPYSLAALRRLWGDGLKLGIKCYFHSSMLELPDYLKDFVSLVSNDIKDDKLPLLNVTLVWKDVGPNTELVVSPIKHATVKGEVNILRYLSRLGPPKYNYELNSEPAMSARVDSILDTCYNMARSTTVKDKQSLIKVLNSHLGKNEFLTGGSSISIADVAAWSVLKQIDAQNLTNNMNSWLQRCSQLLRLDL
ncbi:hypothetical protein L9F63_010811 [Diploptera punctata]|uniref:Aminoacyl tRNA synthase complex-interacting multifunctional protein 2 n=1 Tax=Diploptera punctata TaxID=6984 RepID=A0AAD8AG89_DIPPU|nr:hypothetical protein L9F63_010811 [Diploptera punctata]